MKGKGRRDYTLIPSTNGPAYGVLFKLARRHGVHPNQIYHWKKLLLDNAASLFGRGVTGWDESAEEREREAAKLYAKIGQLTVERDFLAKRSGR